MNYRQPFILFKKSLKSGSRIWYYVSDDYQRYSIYKVIQPILHTHHHYNILAKIVLCSIIVR